MLRVGYVSDAWKEILELGAMTEKARLPRDAWMDRTDELYDLVEIESEMGMKYYGLEW